MARPAAVETGRTRHGPPRGDVMRIRSWSLLALVLVAPTQLSCATIGLTPLQEAMPAARAGLLPEYRLFYDALEDYGDWTLIEPFGYVFRPYGNVEGWRPYQHGYWAPSDVYGWVWISGEPYGWATYHYGEWLFDRYQGWVWIPGLDWGPAWVSWEETPDYIGWAPMLPAGFDSGLIPGGGYTYVPTGQLSSTDVQTRARTRDQIGEKLGTPRPIENQVERDGVRFNAGPKFDVIERRAGPLLRVKIEDLFPGGSPVKKPGAGPGLQPATTPSTPRAVRKPGARPAPGPTTEETPGVDAVRRAAEDAARSARLVTEKNAAPPHSIGVVRRHAKREAPPDERPGEATPRERSRRPGRDPAEADSTKQR
jgi:hypothetical protein